MKYTWGEFLQDIDTLAEKVRPHGFQSLLLVSRGGLFVGGLLAQRLEIQMIDVFAISSFDMQKNRKGLKIYKEGKLNMDRCLLVDDIADSGETLKYIQNRAKCPVATLFYKSKSIITPDFYIHKDPVGWVHFPWEKGGE